MSAIDLVILSIFPGLLAFAACSDLVSMRISNKVSIGLIAAYLPVAFAVGLPAAVIGWSLLLGLIVLALTFGLFALGWIGGGDAKLMSATSVWFGISSVFDYVLTASILGGVLTLVLLMARREILPSALMRLRWVARLHDEKTGIPYGIALSAAGLLLYPSTPIWQRAVGL